MTRPQFTPRRHRAQEILGAVGRAYPEAWRQADDFRALRGKDDLPAWPDWCYLPLHGAEAIVSAGGTRQVPFEAAHHIGILGALAAWRVTQGIYRYDPTLYAALLDTPMPADLPTSVLYRLPEWCVYLETPGYRWLDHELHGAWVHLDWDDHGADELRLLLDTAVTPERALDASGGLIPVPLILGAGGIAQALDRMQASGAMQAQAHGYRVERFDPQPAAASLWPLVSLLLYLCADESEIGAGDRRPHRPRPTKTKEGWRLFPASGLTAWDVGLRLGAAIRRAQEAETDDVDTTGSGRARPRPHLRRAHWHHHWRGPRAADRTEDRELVLRWHPPTTVNVTEDAELPGVIHRVREE